ncbi:MAG: ATP-binding protein [Bacilli bacterium]|nr:ATP-binding protein [Bacilli bacterium]
MDNKIEKSLVKKYKREIYSKFINAIKDYELIDEGDRIAICISGGKDSYLLAECMKVFQKHSKYKYELEFILMNPGYSKKDLIQIKDACEKLNIPLNIYNNFVFKIFDFKIKKSPCFLCSKIRRGYLYNKAKQLGCNKIALGHHFNDVIETVLMNMFYNGIYSGMLPKIKSDNFEDMELIRPLYLVKEEDIISWAKYNNINYINCVCEMLKEKDIGKRKEVKQLISKLKEENKNIDINIFRSLENVNVNTVNGIIKDNKKNKRM